jgi:hypothetical protein
MRPAISALVLAALLVVGAIPPPAAAQAPVAVCHYTGSATAPYVLVEAPAGGAEHAAHEGDLIPAPAGGCPATYQGPQAPQETPTPAPSTDVTLCHAVDGGYVEVTVRRTGLAEHRRHRGDLIPAPEGGCPAGRPDAPPSEDDDDGNRDDPAPAPAPAPAASGGGGGGSPGGGSGGGAGAGISPPRSFSGLPHTGADLPMILLAGLAFLSMGGGLRLLIRA